MDPLSIAHHFQSLGPLGMLLNVAPFAGLLLMIAILPIVPGASHWWEHNRNKLVVSVLCALGGVALYALPTGDWSRVGESYLEYLAFIALLASLFTISGGIHISGSYAGLPYINTTFLAIGAVAANLLGTTGASMLLIRPLLQANRVRTRKSHIVVFFIFIVANCGGLLTPLGDPPLYLGFLRGVPFDWTLRLLPQWALTNLLLLFAFHMLDEREFAAEDIATRGSLVEDVDRSQRRLHIRGMSNLAYLGAVIGAIVASGYWVRPTLTRLYGSHPADIASKALQVLVMGAVGFVSYRTTRASIHRANSFHFGPIAEVAALFFGIFGAMIPALALLDHAGDRLPLSQPWHYFWLAGLLSSFLDNAPTYLTFATLAAGRAGAPVDNLAELARGSAQVLAAISCGSVFMGANTYVGNGPNFMVKAIAEHFGVRMPSFGRYMLWSLCTLVPIFLLQTWLFWR